ncbi:hypothetical protein SAMN05444487_11323 [Marininema mesophilum]|uniref:Uncharacterized protein n=1 Tax=Marininema mesophilum TaxID=1048340 RepID=A0A1H3AB11_9BACL|nr:hypothetical protein [Marininema mesophilum]SDX26907.1 hypothetical protein SAMN05444487_11323 [Marininema mesophilum]
MEKWVQVIVAVASLLRLLMELPDAFFRWKKRMGGTRKERRRRKKKHSA